MRFWVTCFARVPLHCSDSHTFSSMLGVQHCKYWSGSECRMLDRSGIGNSRRISHSKRTSLRPQLEHRHRASRTKPKSASTGLRSQAGGSSMPCHGNPRGTCDSMFDKRSRTDARREDDTLKTGTACRERPSSARKSRRNASSAQAEHVSALCSQT